MKQAALYFILSIFFSALTASSHQAFLVFFLGNYDLKFGPIGTVIVVMWMSIVCAAVPSFIAALWASIAAMKNAMHFNTTEICFQTLANGIIIGFLCLPITYNTGDNPALTIGVFLILGVITAIFSAYLSNKFVRQINTHSSD